MNHGVDLINNDNDSARKVFTITLEQSNRIKYDYGIGSSYARLGYIEGHEGHHREGLEYTLKALKHFQKINRTKGIITCYINLGYNYDILGMADSALYYFLDGIRILEEEKSEPGKLARLYENVGNFFGNRGELSKAVPYAKRSIELATSIHDTDYIVTSYTTLCNIYRQNKAYEPALEAARQALKYLHNNNDRVLLIKVYSNLGAAYAKLNKPDSAIEASKRSMEYSASFDIENFIAAGLDLADAYEQKKDYAKQKEVLNVLRQKAESQNNLFHLFSIYDGLARLNYATGNYKEAYVYNTKSQSYKDSFFSQKSRKDIFEIEARYQTAQKEKALSENQLQLTQKELALKKSNQYILFSIAGIVLTGLIALIFFLQARNRKKAFALELNALQKQKEIYVLEALMQGEEKERSRIAKDLHDGVAGTLAAAKMHLSSIVHHTQNLLQSDNYRQSVQLLDDATNEVRKTSHNLMPEVLLQYGLDEAMRRYCNNISNQNLTVQYDSWGDVQRFYNSFELTVYRIVQELLNNILKHSKATEAMVQLSHQNNILSVTVEDNGIGFINDDTRTTGMGLQSLRSRIKTMNGKLEIETSPGNGVSAYLEFDTTGLIKKDNSSAAA
ncbi:MAG: tetratricopeptide repeat-containing sensor histidine kinase [Ilyomonas sp.]